MNNTRKIIITIISLTLSACVFQPSVQQGNFIEQDKVEQIEIGMTKNQIRFLMGTPMIDDPFNENRWDYVYFLKIGRNQAISKTWVSIIFDENTVSQIIKDQNLSPNL